MKMRMRLLVGAALLAGVIGTTPAMAVTITKSPDLGRYWQPLSSGGNFVYADSFIAPISGVVSNLGTWFLNGGSQYRLQVLADAGVAGPDGSSILAQTAVQQGTYSELTYVNFSPLSSALLVGGQKYWFAASTVGLGGGGSYTVGGHTQNSGGINDDGTFWYSNDPAGLAFDGRGQTPEMAFTVDVTAVAPGVPEPATWGMMILGFGIAAAAMRRRSSVTTRVRFAG